SPQHYNQYIPAVLSAIIIKLLAKNAEERYQNAFGLKSDLEECQRQYNQNQIISTFDLGKSDISIKFNIPQTVVGRENEINILLDAYKRVSSGAREFILVSGDPGIGKSSVINELHKPIVAAHGYFITGKYEQFRRDVPYSAIIQAFQGLVKQILTESKENINIWKNKILKAVGVNGKIIIPIIPSIQLIIGNQPDIPELLPEQAQILRMSRSSSGSFDIFPAKSSTTLSVTDNLSIFDISHIQPKVESISIICSS
ncbi:AAA family ATPase, partial [Dolichospermum sp. ST_sed1]|nr:AAA family ATPase [Dolichospermum sp. ST_sed1]